MSRADGHRGSILCGVDRSDEARHAAQLAAALAARTGMQLVLLHAAPEPWISSTRPDYLERLEEQTAFDRAGYLSTVVEPIEVDPAAQVERTVEFGQPIEVLRSAAAERGAAFLVVGSRGQGAVEEVLVGSTSGALARDAPCPVIVVPARSAAWVDDAPETTIVCGVDGSDVSLEAARRAAGLAQLLPARLVLAHVVEPGREPDELPADLVEDVRAAAPGVPIELRTLHGRPADELLELARRMDARLLAVGSRGRGPIAAVVLGSVSSRVLEESERPVMVVSRRSLTAAGRAGAEAPTQ